MNSLSEVPPEEKFIPPTVTRLGLGILIGDAATRSSSSPLEDRPRFGGKIGRGHFRFTEDHRRRRRRRGSMYSCVFLDRESRVFAGNFGFEHSSNPLCDVIPVEIDFEDATEVYASSISNCTWFSCD